MPEERHRLRRRQAQTRATEVATDAKPTLYAGARLPLHALAPDALEDFLYVVFHRLGPTLGFRPSAKPSGTGDGGFDIDAIRTSDGALVCIQCKRLEASLGLPVVAEELAKVAFKTFCEHSVVREHYIITTGRVQDQVRSVLRGTPRTEVVAAARASAVNPKKLRTLRDRVVAAGGKPEDVAEAYIGSLEVIEAWSGHELDTKLTLIWSQLQPELDRFFSVHTVLANSPRPEFAETSYLNRVTLAGTRPLSLLAVDSALPPQIRRQSAARPLERLVSRESGTSGQSPLEDLVVALGPGQLLVVLAPGGGGKSTSLELVRDRLATTRRVDSGAPLPILVRLGEYRGALDALVHRSLDVQFGNWRSLPGAFVLLLDGLNETEPSEYAALGAEIGQVLERGGVTVVLSVRDSGLRSPVVIEQITSVVRLLPFDRGQVLELARRALGPDEVIRFGAAFWGRITSANARFLLLPFCVQAAIFEFFETGSVPSSRAQLVQRVITGRIQRNQELAGTLRPELRELPPHTIIEIAKQLAFTMRVLRARTALLAAEIGVVLAEVLASATRANLIGAERLGSLDLLTLLIHFEFLLPAPSGVVAFSHDLVAGYLAAGPLATDWRAHLAILASTVSDDAWILAGGHVNDGELGDFYSAIAAVSPILCAEAAVETGPRAVRACEASLLAGFAGARTRYDVWRSAMALGMLGSPGAIAQLSAASRQALEPLRRSEQAQRALAIAGDREFLTGILVEADPIASGPLRASGGALALWQVAPRYVALTIARERLDCSSPGDALTLPLRTVAGLGDDSDVARVDRVLENCRDLLSWRPAFRALHSLKPALALERLRSAAAEAKLAVRVGLYCTMHELGQSIDSGWLFDYVMNGGRESTPGDQAEEPGDYVAVREAEGLLGQICWDGDLRLRARAAYEFAGEEQRERLWTMATACKLSEFDDVARAHIVSGNEREFGRAAFFIDAREQAAGERSGLIALIAHRVESDLTLRSTSGYVAGLQVLSNSGLGDIVRRHGFRQLEESLAVSLAGNRSTAFARETRTTAADAGRAFVADMIVRAVCVAVAPFMRPSEPPPGFLLGLLSLKLSSIPEPDIGAIVAVLSGLEADLLDESVSQISHPLDRAAALDAVVRIGVTDRRVQLFLSTLSEGINHPAVLPRLQKALERLWSEELGPQVITLVAEFRDWEAGRESQFFDEMAMWIANALPAALLVSVSEPLLAAELHPTSRRLLELWNDIGAQRRGS